MSCGGRNRSAVELSSSVGNAALPRSRRLADLAARQHGVVALAQLHHIGYSTKEVWGGVEVGRLHSIHREVYAVGHTNLTLHGQCLAAVFAAGDGAVLSHYSAAWLWGLSRSNPVPVHVTAPVPRPAKLVFVRHRARRLEPRDRAELEGIPATAVPRTLLDLAARLSGRRLRRMLERAEELGVLDLAPIEDLLPRTVGHPGNRKLEGALALYRPPPFTRSELERSFVDAVEGAGLPQPATGWNEVGYELDVFWPEQRFAVELDVFETHGSRESFEADRLRQEELKLAGIELVRITGRRFEREPRRVLERLARLLEARGAEL